MQIDLIEEKENKFFNRKDLKILIRHEGVATPSKSEVVKMLALSNNVDESQVAIKYIFTKKGAPESFASVAILREKPPEKTEAKKEVAVGEAQAGQSA